MRGRQKATMSQKATASIVAAKVEMKSAYIGQLESETVTLSGRRVRRPAYLADYNTT